MSKVLLAGGIVRDLLFDRVDSMEIYLRDLDLKKQVYQILDQYLRDDGTVIIRIVCQYNQVPLVQLYKED